MLYLECFFPLAIIQWPSLPLLILVWCLFCEITTPPYFWFLLVWNIIFHLLTFSTFSQYGCVFVNQSVTVSWKKKTKHSWALFKDSVLLFPPYPSEGLHAHSPLFSTVLHLFYCLFILLGAHTCYSACVEVRRQTPFRSPFLLLPLRPQGWNSVL